ncbi:MAG TPA: hypothetical protein VN083_09605 [Vicinamibacteria bacterium]|jgi:hypothetical protein|nr:hypothetical protein [Vicinamibacteria bacterium]
MPLQTSRLSAPPPGPAVSCDATPPLSGSLRFVLSRGLLLVFWSFVFWGTLISGVLLWSVVAHGWAASLALLRPRGWEGWANLLLVPFSLVVWCGVAVALAGVSMRPKRGPASHPRPL